MATKTRSARTRESAAGKTGQPGALIATNSGTRIDHDTIALLAYSYWQERGGAGGSAEDDWLRAEAELNSVTKPARALPARRG